jgi:hypothetical protein
MPVLATQQTAWRVRLPLLALGAGDWLSCAVLLLALWPCLAGIGPPFPWLVLALLLPGARLLASGAYRARLSRLWRQLDEAAGARGKVPWLAAVVFAGLPAVPLYLLGDRPAGALDSAPVVPSAISLVRQGDWELSEFVPAGRRDSLPYYLTRTCCGVYSCYSSGMVPFALPAVLAARCLGADLDSPKVLRRLEKWTAAWVACACLSLFFLLALRLAPPAPALATTALLATGSVLYTVVGQGLWQHGGIVLWMLLILLVEFHLKTPERVGWGALVQGAAAGLLVATRLTSVAFLVPFGLWLLWRTPRRGFVVPVVALLVFAPWAYLYYALYGTPWGPSSVQLGEGHWSADLFTSLAGILVSPARGLFVYQPWLLLGLALLVPTVRRHRLARSSDDEPPGWRWLFASVIVGQLVLIAAWRNWWGGHSWGSRLLTEIVPLLALLCVRPVAVLWQYRPSARLIVAVGLLSFALHVSGALLGCRSWNVQHNPDENQAALWDWSDAPFFSFPIHAALEERVAASTRRR